jgi:hypothetical protein
MSVRFTSWLAIGIAAGFLVIATAVFSLSTIVWLSFVIGIGTLLVSGGIAYSYRQDIASLVLACVVAVISGWTVVASLVFSQATVQNLTLASALAVSGLAVAGLATHEMSLERVAHSLEDRSKELRSRLAEAA